MKIISIEANAKIKIDIRISRENSDGLFEVKEDRFIILNKGQSFIGFIDIDTAIASRIPQEVDKTKI